MKKKPIKILDYCWHISHQYSLVQIPNTKWTWLMQYKRPYGTMPRGDMIKEFNIEQAPYYEKGKYDIAIMHLDQQCIREDLWLRGKGSVYREFNEVITDIPKIVICHGTPYWPEEFSSEEIVSRVKRIVGDNTMVVNSYRAKEQWGWGDVIIHGIDKNDWLDLPKEPRIVTMISPAGLDKYYDRDFLRAVKEELLERGLEHCHISVDVHFNNFEDYREFLGRSLIYFNPTRESPMPRSRTEAMLSGCCLITTPHQDADTFIKDGINGFITIRNPKVAADLIEERLQNYKESVKIGQKGKETAIKLFSQERFNEDWRLLINKTLEREAL
ncbi:MAG: glycosyltransferase [Candidatus Lokiarchaeota archaeon]|nr:glycosyltransferase [Candidatus Lokiarchaeota archaeon]